MSTERELRYREARSARNQPGKPARSPSIGKEARTIWVRTESIDSVSLAAGA